MISPPVFTRFVLAAALAGLGGCSSDVNPMRDAFLAAGVGAVPPKAQPFIERSRPAEPDYRPVEAAPRARPLRAKTAAEISQVEAELDAVRNTNDRIGAETRAAATTTGTPGN